MPIIMKHTPGEWDGTFGVLVLKLAEDLLSDAPFGAPTTPVRIDGEARLRMLSGVDGMELVFADGSRADSQEITEIEVP